MKRPVDSKIQGIRFIIPALFILHIGLLMANCSDNTTQKMCFSDPGCWGPVYMIDGIQSTPTADPLCTDDTLTTALSNTVPVNDTVDRKYRYNQSPNGSQVTFTATNPACVIGGVIGYCNNANELIGEYYYNSTWISCTDTNPVVNGTPRVCTITLGTGTRIVVHVWLYHAPPCSYTVEMKQL